MAALSVHRMWVGDDYGDWGALGHHLSKQVVCSDAATEENLPGVQPLCCCHSLGD